MVLSLSVPLTLLICACLTARAAGLAINSKEEYLIKQGALDDGSLFMYSPYFLWHGDINNKSNALLNPLELRPTKGFLDVTFTVRAVPVTNEAFSFNTRVFCYNDACNIPAPTIHVSPKDTIKITIVNELAATSGVASAGPLEGQVTYPNRTNFFIQGLNLDPSINNPYRYTSGGGDSLVYEYTIPDDAPPGVNWYHSRVHGVSALHVLGGLVGAFIVDPVGVTGTLHNGTLVQTTPLPKALDAIVRRVVVFSHTMLEAPRKTIPGVVKNTFSLIDEPGSAGFSNSSLSYTYLSRAYGSKMPLNASYNATLYNNTAQAGRHLSDVWLTNGQYQPTLTLQPGEWRVLDVVVASGDRMLELEVRTAVGYGKGTEACDVRLLALDGVYLNSTRTGPAARHITLLQSGRASIAIMCADEGTYYLQSATTFDTSDPRYIIGDFQTKSSQNLLTLSIVGIKYVMSAPPSDLSIIQRPMRVVSNSGVVHSGYSVDKVSISTAQGGCCGLPTTATSTDGVSSITSTNSDNTNPCNAQYWLGMGTDCKPACYGALLCAALQSVLTATQLDHVYTTDAYSVLTFPTSRNGHCGYRSFAGYANMSTNSSSSDECFDYSTHNDAQTIALARQYAPSDTALPTSTPIVTLDNIQELTLWGHADFAYPLFVQNNIMQLGSFMNVDSSVSNIVDSGEYVQHSAQDSTYYALPGDFKETWPALTGQSKLYLKVQQYTGSLLLLTSFLKFEDMGVTRDLLVQPSSGLPAPTLPPVTTPTEPTLPTPSLPPVVSPPRSAQLDSDSAQRQYLCDTSGTSFYYAESLDVTARTRTIVTHSCPNHFALCQSSQCGGDLKTRALISEQVVVVPLYPTISRTAPIDTTCSDRLLGVALNGVGLYGVSDGQTRECVDLLGDTAAGHTGNYTKELYGRTSCVRQGQYDGLLYCGDAVRTVGRSIDKCGGYASRDGIYKYHVAPTCLLQQLSPNSVRDHSPQLGWALDGFPVFGPVGAKGIAMLPCGGVGAHSVLCLDVCGGYQGKLPGYDKYLYRYYVPGPLPTGECSSKVENAGNCSRVEGKCCTSSTPPAPLRPYNIGCFRGCPFSDTRTTNQERNPDRGAYLSCKPGIPGTLGDFVPSVSSYATEVFSRSNEVSSVPEEEEVDNVITTTGTSNATTPIAPVNSRTILTMAPFDSVLSLLTVNSTTGVVSQESIPRSLSDTYLTGLYIDRNNTDTVYYATQMGIHSYDQVTKATTTIIAGLLSVAIRGYNLGATIADVRSITVGGEVCTSIVHASPEHVMCTIVLRTGSVLYSTINNRNGSYVSGVSESSTDAELSASVVPYTIDQVTYTTIGGSTSGVSAVPLAVVRSGSGRPTMTHIKLTLEPFSPYTLTVVTHRVDSTSSSGSGGVSYEKTLYWSNVAYGAHSIQRSRMDGTQVETVVNNVERAVSLRVLAVHIDQALQYLYTDNTLYENASASAALYSTLPVCDSGDSGDSGGYISGLLSTVSSVVSTSGDSTSTPTCRSVGHALFFADTAVGTLTKLHLLPISTSEVFVSDRNTTGTATITNTTTTSTTATPRYTSVFHAQDALYSTVNTLSQPIVLVQGMDKIQGFALDWHSSYVFLNALDGAVFRMNLAYLLDTTTTITTTSSTSVTTSTTSNNFTLPVTLNMRDLLQHASAKRLLPRWVKLLRKLDSRARLHGVCVVPSVASKVGMDGSRNVAAEWNQERILSLDTNKQHIVALSEEGVHVNSLNIGTQYRVFWPHQLRCFERVAADNHTLPLVDVYLAGYLGRLWKFTLERDSQSGRFNLQKTAAPTLVMDKSVFPASVRLRAFLNAATAPESQPFFDVI